jgi:hypothetical protein
VPTSFLRVFEERRGGSTFTKEHAMSRSFSHLRRALFGLAFVGSLGFGATQALASPEAARAPRYCPVGPGGQPYYSDYCGFYCAYGVGYCNEVGVCRCGLIP